VNKKVLIGDVINGVPVHEIWNTGDTLVNPDGVAVVDNSLINAKGDILVGTGNDAIARVAVGANNTYLQADSTQPAGVKWASVASSGQAYYVVSNGSQLDAALVALRALGGGVIQLSGPDFTYAPAANRDITNISILGSTTGIAMTKLTFTNANYWYGTNIHLEHMGIDPYLSNPIIRLQGPNAHFIRISKLQHRGTPAEIEIDCNNYTVYMWSEQVVSCRISNSTNVVAYAYDGSGLTFTGGGTAYIDDTSSVSGATINLSSLASRNSNDSSVTGATVKDALNELNKVVVPSGATGARPVTPVTGQSFFDTTLGKPIWFDGTNWIDASGTEV